MLSSNIGTAGSAVKTPATNLAIDSDAVFHADADSNIGIGANALNSISGDADYNTAVGVDALTGNTTGDQNVAIGYKAGEAIYAHYNTFVGAYSGDAILNNNHNTAVGRSSLSGAAGEDNTAIGSGAMNSNANSGANVVSYNVAIGKNALLGGTASGGNVRYNVAIGALALDGTTTNAMDGTIAIGYNALGTLTSGSGNIAMGYAALSTTTTGSNNVAIGSSSLGSAGAGAAGNIAIGYRTLYTAISGTCDNNVMIGVHAGYYLNAATNNVAIGENAMGLAGFDGGVGVRTDAQNSSGNTFIGQRCAYGTVWEDAESTDNVAIGREAFKGALNGAENNTIVGTVAGIAITEGDDNVCVGTSAGDTITTGVGNVCIGKSSDVGASQSNSISIGKFSAATGNNAVTIGHNITNSTGSSFMVGMASNYITVGFSGTQTFDVSSDIRKKQNIKSSKLGLDFINDLNPVTFQWKSAKDFPEEWEAWSYEDGKKVYDEMDTETVHYGLIAQEVKASMDKFDASDFSGWSVGQKGIQNISREIYVIPLIKAVQELSQQVEELKSKIGDA